MDPRRLSSTIVLTAIVFGGVSNGWAEPYFAQREGYRCSKCHVNGTGGGMRTSFGRQWAWTHLSMVGPQPPGEGSLSGAEADEGPAHRLWWAIDPQLTDAIAVGANVRVSHETVFGQDRVSNSIENPEANLYVALDALDFLTLYGDISVAEGSVEAREAFVLLHGFSGFRLKAGILLLPYGLRIWGEEEFIRARTGFLYAEPDLGIELGFEWRGLGIFLAVSNGAGGGIDADNFKKISATAEWADTWWRLGGSWSYNRTDRTELMLQGGHVGLTLGRLSLLGEVDYQRTTNLDRGRLFEEIIAYAEANFLLLKGFNLKVAYGFNDINLAVSEDQRINIRGGVELFIIPMLATSLFYDFREAPPADEVRDADVLAVELHLYL